MAVSANYLTWTKQAGLGDQPVTGFGFQLKALIIWSTRKTNTGATDGAMISNGMTDGVKQVCRYTKNPDNEGTTTSAQVERTDALIYQTSATSGATPTVENQASIVSLDSDGFTINWSINDGAADIWHAIGLGGDDFDCQLDSIKLTGGINTTYNVTGLPFTPNGFICIGGAAENLPGYNLGAPYGSFHGFGFASGVSTAGPSANTYHVKSQGLGGESAAVARSSTADFYIETILSNSVLGPFNLAACVINAIGLNSYQIRRATAFVFLGVGVTHPHIHILAFRGAQFKVGQVTTPTTPGTKTVTLAFEPSIIFLGSTGDEYPTQSTTKMDLSMGAWCPFATGCVWQGGENASDPSIFARSHDEDITLRLRTPDATGSSSAAYLEANVDSVSATGFVLDFPTVPGNQRRLFYAAFEANVTPPPPEPPSEDNDAAPGPITTATFTDRSLTARKHSTIDLNDPADYYDGYASPKLLSALPIRRALSDTRGQTQHTDYGALLDDTGRTLRAMDEDATNKFIVNRPLVIRTIRDIDRRALLPYRVEMCGFVTAAKPRPNLQYELKGSDWLKKAVSRIRPGGGEFWQPRLTLADFSRLPVAQKDKAAQLVYGPLSDEVTTAPGIFPRGNADPGWIEFGYNGWAVGTLNTQTYYVYMTTITGGVESMRYAFEFGFAANPSSPAFHIRFQTAIVPDFYRIYLTDAPQFEPFTNPLAGTFARVLDITPGDAPSGVNPYDPNYVGQFRWFLIDNDAIGDDYHDLVTNGGSIPLVPAKGACPTQYVGEEDVNGDGVLWSMFLVTRGAIKDFTDAFVGGVRVTSYGAATEMLAPFKTDYVTTFGANYRDLNGTRYTIIYANGATALNAINGQAPITCNIDGIETVGDTSGDSIRSPLRIRQHVERNFVIPDIPPATLWSTVADNLPIGIPTQNDDSYDQAETDIGTRITGGYEGAGIIGAGGELEQILSVFAALSISGDFDAGINRKGQTIVSVEPNTAPDDADVFVFDHVLLINAESFSLESDVSRDFWNVIPFNDTKDFTGQTQKGWLLSGESQDAASITNYQIAKRYQEQNFDFLRANSDQGIDTIVDVVKRERLRFRHPRRTCTLDVAFLKSADVELGSVLRLTHLEGTGAAGWIGHDVRVIAIECALDPSTRRFTAYDLQPIYDGLDDAIDPTHTRNAASETTLAQLQGNINDNAAELAALEATVNALGIALEEEIDDVRNRTRVRVATTGNITIATALNAGDTIDGITLVAGDLVLVKDQTADEENGIYVAGVTPARDEEFDTYNEHCGTLIVVKEGSSQADTLWLCTSDDGGLLNTDPITFVEFTGGSTGVSGNARVRVATTANITIATALNNGDTLDGITLADGDLILVKNQSAQEENGIYVVGASPARDTAFDTFDEHPGMLIAVEEGTANADTLWLCTADLGGTLNTTAITFASFGSGGITQLTGDVTAGPGTGSQAATIANDAVTYAKMQNISAASRILGRGSAAGSGDPEELTLGTGLTLTGTVLSSTVTGGITQLTGDVTAGPGSGSVAATIANDAVTYAKMQNVSAASRILGRGSAGGSGDVEELTAGGGLGISGTAVKFTGDITVGCSFDGRGATLVVGTKFRQEVPVGFTITAVRLLADQAGAVTLTIKKSSYSGFPGSLTSIVGSSKPTITASNQKSEDTTLSTWTTSVSAHDILEYTIDTVTTIQQLTVQLTGTIA